MIDAATTEARAKEVFGKYTNTSNDMNPNHSGESFDGLHSNWNTGAEAKYEEAFTVNGRLYTCAKEGLLNSLDKIVADKASAGADAAVTPKPEDGRMDFLAANKKAGLKSITSGTDENGNETRTVTMDKAVLQSFLGDATTNATEIDLLDQEIAGTKYLFIGVGWTAPNAAAKMQVPNGSNGWKGADSWMKAADGAFYEYFAVAKLDGTSWVLREPAADGIEFTFRFVDSEGNQLGSVHTSTVTVVFE